MTSSEIVNAYVSGASTSSLCERSGLNRGMIQRLLLKAGVKLRKRTPSIEYNKAFFDEYTTTSCYWAGFILADGCVASKRAKMSVHLALKDVEHLTKLADAIGYPKAKIYHGKTCCLNVHGEWFPNALFKNFDITPQKSLTATFPSRVPEQFYAHLIRGIVDGDGSIGSLPNNSGSTLNIVGTKSLLQSVADIFKVKANVSLKSGNVTPPIQMRSQAGLISWSGQNADRILEWLYADSIEQLRLTRKYHRWMEVRKS